MKFGIPPISIESPASEHREMEDNEDMYHDESSEAWGELDE